MKKSVVVFLSFVAWLRAQSSAFLIEQTPSAAQTALAGTGKEAEIGQIFYNPAVLARDIASMQLSLSYLYMQDGASFFGGYGQSILPNHFLALGLSYLRYNDLMSVNEYGQVTGSFAVFELLGGISHSVRLSEKFSLGHTWKIYYLNYERERAQSLSLDGGLLYQLNRYVILGLQLQNLTGTSYRLAMSEESLPLRIDFGPTFVLWDGKFLLHYTLRHNSGIYSHMPYSFEHRISGQLMLWRKSLQLLIGNSPTGFSFGIMSEIDRYRLSFAWQPLAFETRLHAGLSLRFDTSGSSGARSANNPDEELYEFYEAMELYNAGEYKSAYDKFDRILKLNPDHKLADLYRQRCLLHLRSGNFLDEEEQKIIDMHKDLARRYESEGKFGEAIYEWRQVLEINPADAEAEPNLDRIKKKVYDKVLAFHRQGLENYRQNDLLKAIDSFAEALKLNPEYEPSKNWLAKIKQELSQEELKERERIEKLQKAEVFYNRGLSYYGRKTYEEAIKEFDEALLLNPNHENAKKYRQMALEELEAERLGLKGLEAAKSFYEKGMKNYNEEKFYEAKRDFAMALRAYPAFKEASEMIPRAEASLAQQIKPFMNEALTNYRKRKFSAAVENFNMALKLDPENKEAKEYLEKIQNEKEGAIRFHFGEGQRAYNAKDYSKAIYHLNEVVFLDEGHLEANRLLAQARDKVRAETEQLHSQALKEFEAQRYDEAIALWKRVLELDAANKVAENYIEESEKKKRQLRSKALVAEYLKRGKELYENKDFEQALGFFNKALKEDPQNAEAQEYARLCEEALGREKNQELISRLFIEGVREYKKREYEKAIAKWKEVKNLDPQNPLVDRYIAQATEAQKNRKFIDFMNGQKYYEEGKWLLAKSAFERALQENPQNTKAREMLQDTLDRIAEERNAILLEADKKMRAAQYNEAAADYLAAYRLDPSAEIQQKRENALKAQEYYEQGLRYFNSDQDIGLSIESFLKVLELNPFDKRASDYINQAKEIGKNRINNWMAQAARAEEGRDYRRAFALYRSVLEVDPANTEAKKGLSRARKELRNQAAIPYKEGKEALALKNYALAIEHFTKVLELVSDYEDAPKLLEQARQELAKKRQAAAKAQVVSPVSESENALINEGIVLYRQGKYKEAIAVWQKIPKNSEAYSKAQRYIARARLKE
ncbi:MAG: tetratricopeptide repeat protein [Leptospiraceae bacterium]|nr:tetratricopeptide repeat protein [Leptospiraceae bacterium]